MTESQPYEVVWKQADRDAGGAFELRRDPEHVVAQVEVSADFEDAGTVRSAISSATSAATT